ncbi:MAG: VCBS repeat-containing protein, partial [Thermoplasmata archaeon]|nr:VCBS repeat-containing protein [Thermoplasmata archaeon]
MDRRALAVLILVALMAFSGLSGVGTQTRGDLGDTYSIFSVEDAKPWTDGFDDMQNVYIPPGGLIGTEVIGGQATLAGSTSEGWVASSIIKCPAGVRYDLVVLDATLPGDSRIEISVLDASAEATEVGYANATINNHKDLDATAVTIKSIDQSVYPEIRIQATLFASGSDVPTIEGWAVYFCPFDEWREDFVSMVRMDTLRGLDLNSGNLELDLTEHQGMTGRSGSTSTTPYPAIVFDRYATGGSNVMNVFYPNFDRTGYKDVTDLSATGTRELQIHDFDGDGFLDIFAGNYYFNGQNPDSQIYWGKSDGTWSQSDTTDLDVVRTIESALGDFDGDGLMDIATACFHQTGSASSAIFLNPGNREWSYTPDVSFTDMEFMGAGAGDFNNDGYDDVVFATTGDALAYYGGPGGPDKTADLDWDYTGYVYQVLADDLDADGYDDVIILNNAGDSKVRIHMGSASGLDTTPDHLITVGDSPTFGVAAGDLDNDDITDLVVMGLESSNRYLYIFKGTTEGWSGSTPHKISTGNSYAYGFEVVDINVDGLNDLVAGWGSEMRVYYGSDGSFPSTPDITKSGLWSSNSIAVATGGKTSTRKFAGRMTTQTINLPSGKVWDTLVLEGNVPKNTSFTITIKDTSNRAINGFEDLTSMDVDLAGLTTPAIKVEMWLESDLNTSSPVIDRLRLRWQDPGTWREQFFGPAKAARTLGTSIIDGHLTAAPGTSG